MSESDERAARLAAQLRANLHRRKAQARAAEAADATTAGEASAAGGVRADREQAAARDIGDAGSEGE
jgi:hypothetical protein